MPGSGPFLVVLIGAAGSGKSSLARLAWDDSRVLSLDALRAMVSGDECDQAATPDAVTILHRLVRARLRRRLTTVVDATNVQARAREPLLAIARDCAVPAAAIVVATPLQVCLARNRTRPGPAPGARWGRRVPDTVVREQYADLRRAAPSLGKEGFARVITYDGTAHPEMSDVRGKIQPVTALQRGGHSEGDHR
jgi:predicted kinase